MSDFDYLANVKAAKTLAKNILGAKLCLIDNAGHEINVTAPKRLANAMSDFMSQ